MSHFGDLYENSVVPIALARRYTAISLMPGGRVLDIFTWRALAKGGWSAWSKISGRLQAKYAPMSDMLTVTPAID